MHCSHKWSGDKVCLCDFISCWPLTVWAWQRRWCKAFNRQGIKQQRKTDRVWPSVAAVLHFSVQQILRSIYKEQMFKAYSSYLRFIGSPLEIVLTQVVPWSLSVGLSSNYNHILANEKLQKCSGLTRMSLPEYAGNASHAYGCEMAFCSSVISKFVPPDSADSFLVSVLAWVTQHCWRWVKNVYWY